MAPRAADRMPAEWAPHRACWIAWPSHGDLWGEALPAVRRTFVDLCRAIVDPGPGPGPGSSAVRGEALEVLALDAAGAAEAETALGGLPGVRFHTAAFGDVWLRDTAPIFVHEGMGGLAAVRFRFNGWGGKYRLPGDETVAARIAELAGVPVRDYDLVAEGGALEVDGEGTVLTTRQCLLNANRNPGADEASVDAVLKAALGAERVVWLDEGLVNDHTDGHIDTLARFIAPGRVICMRPEAGDPNRAALDAIRRTLAVATDAAGRRLEVVEVPSPGCVLDEDGKVMPASYVNYYLSESAVIVPIYGKPVDQAAVDGIAACFPGRRPVAIDARALLGGGGAFHCITQQEPRPASAGARSQP
jgi:agmatine deiminase